MFMIAVVKRLVLVIFPMCAALVMLVPAAAPHSQWATPDYWHPFGFEACELPCWAGIHAGDTRFNRATDLLLENLPGRTGQILASGSQINFAALYDDRLMTGILYYNGGFVSTVDLQVPIEIGVLIEQIGLPSCVWIDDRAQGMNATMVVYWERQQGAMGAMIPNFRPAYALNRSVLTSGFWMNNQRSPCEDSALIAWRGFAPAWRYVVWKKAQQSTQ